MSCVKDGYWRSKGEQITLDSYISRTHHYVPRYVLENGNDIILKGKLQQSLEYCETGTCYFVGSVIYEGKREIVVFVSTPDQMEEQRMECPNDDRLDFCFKEGCLIIENAGFSAKISLPIHPESNCNILNECGYRKVIVKYGMLSTVVLLPKHYNPPYPAIAICLGGPFIDVPDFNVRDSVYQLFLRKGFAVIIPLRRGVLGVSKEWTHGLNGHLGKADVFDVIAGTKEAIEQVDSIDRNRIGIYGASFGGYTALLAIEDKNDPLLFKAACVVCAMSDPDNYPYESQGNINETRRTYENAPSPIGRCANIRIPSLIIHTCDDETVWFGQSVRLYNKMIEECSSKTELAIFSGPHSMDIPHRQDLEDSITGFFKNELRK